MEQRDKVRFVKCMAALAESFSQDYSTKKIDIYYQALEDLTIEDIERGTWNVIRTRGTSTFPKVAEIREAINGKREDRSMLALAKVERALREVAAYSSIVFDDPVIHKVIESFNNSWIGIADMTIQEWTWARKDFLRLYEALSTSGVDTVPHKLRGRIEIENENNGYAAKYPLVYFGDKQACLDWQAKIPEMIEYIGIRMPKLLEEQRRTQ